MSQGYNQGPKFAGPSSVPQQSVSSGKATAALILGLLSFFFSCLTGLPGLILGIIALSDISSSQGRLTGKGKAIFGIVASLILPGLGVLVAFLVAMALGLAGIIGAGTALQSAAFRVQSQNNMKIVAIGSMNYHDVHSSFPHPAEDAEYQAKLSWRTDILPFVEQAGMYDQLNHEAGWSDPANMSFADMMPAVYGDPLRPDITDRATIYATYNVDSTDSVKVGLQGGARLSDFSDGTSNTIMLVEEDVTFVSSVWLAGYDHAVDLNNPSFGLMNRGDVYLVTFADGSVTAITVDIDSTTLGNMFGRDDGQVVDFFMYTE